MQSKQNRICALWWFQGFKSLAVEFTVWCSLMVWVAAGSGWFCELAGEWDEKEPRREATVLSICLSDLKNTDVLLCHRWTIGDRTWLKSTLWPLDPSKPLYFPHMEDGAVTCLIERDFLVCTDCVSLLPRTTTYTAEGHRGSEEFKSI